MARYTVQHVRLNAGGYDRHGQYFGTGQRLYWIASPDGADDLYIRAADHAHAAAIAVRVWPRRAANGTWPRDTSEFWARNG